MERRKFVRSVVAVTLAPKWLLAQQAGPVPPPPAPVPWTLGLNPKTPLPQTVVADALAESDLVFFSAEQMAALTRLSDLLMPALEGKPGALQAQTPAFLDFLIGGSPEARRTLYAGGLDWLNAESKRKYRVPFANTDAAQADALVKPWMRTWMTDHPPTEAHADFFNIVHADVRSATMSSKAWSDAESPSAGESLAMGLYWSPIEPDIYAVNPNSVHLRPSPVISAPRSNHESPSYPR